MMHAPLSLSPPSQCVRDSTRDVNVYAVLPPPTSYFDQLNSLERKIPSHEVQVAFKWKDAFDRGSLFGGRISLTVSSLAYEKACVLFNLGAISSIIAADQNVDSEDGMQKALKRLQLASGVFSQLKTSVVGLIQTDPTPDLEPDTLSVLSGQSRHEN